jgi:colanic acid/amylovoran biosynthesis glycosyltransferase
MKIAIVVPIFPNIMQPYILNHILFLKDRDMLSKIIASTGKETFHDKLKSNANHIFDNVIYINTCGFKNVFRELLASLCRSNIFWIIKESLMPFQLIDLKKYGAIYFIKKVAKQQVLFNSSFDIIHSHSLFSSYDFLFLKEHYNIPLLTTYHGDWPQGVQPLAHHKIEQVLNTGDMFLVNTQFAKKKLLSLGCNESKVIILPQGIDLEQFYFVDRFLQFEKIILLSVTRLSTEKGLHYAIEAVAHFSQHINVEYRIVGDGPEMQSLKSLAETLRVMDKVKFLGCLNQKQLIDQYKEAHILLHPSVHVNNGATETQGVVMQEAQAMGLPVIATKIGGIPECIKDGETGLLVEDKNAHAIAQKIQFLLDHPDHYKALSLAGRRDVEDRFDINKIGARLLTIYKNVIDQLSRTNKTIK